MRAEDIGVTVTVGGIPLFSATLENLRLLRTYAAYMEDETLGEIGCLLVDLFKPKEKPPLAP